MNILSLIFAVLLMLALFTQVQMENFTNFTIIKKEYDNHTKDHARESFNQKQFGLYMEGIKQPHRNYDRRLNFWVFLDEEGIKKHVEIAKQHQFIAKELIRILFRQTNYYKNMEESNGEFLEEFMLNLVNAAKGRKIKFADSIDKLQLQNPEFQTVFYHMLTGMPYEIKLTTHLTLSKSDEEEEKEPDIWYYPEDFQSQIGFICLKDFMHFRPNSLKIGIYLAPREILEAMFIDSDFVKQIIEKRKEVYLKFKDNTFSSLDIAKQKLSEFITDNKNQLKSEVKLEILDFTVIDSDPTMYEQIAIQYPSFFDEYTENRRKHK